MKAQIRPLAASRPLLVRKFAGVEVGAIGRGLGGVCQRLVLIVNMIMQAKNNGGWVGGGGPGVVGETRARPTRAFCMSMVAQSLIQRADLARVGTTNLLTKK